MPAYSGITTRTSMSSARSALGSAPATSASPPVFAKGAVSEATKRTFSGDAGTKSSGARRPQLASVYAIVDVRENIVAALHVGEPRNCPLAWGRRLQLVRAQVVVDLVELQDVLVDAPGGVGDGRSRLHDERPVGGLRQHQLARRLVQRARGQRVGGGMPARELHHPLGGDVQVTVGPAVGLVQPVVVVALEAPRRRAGRRHLVGVVAFQVVARRRGLDGALVEVQLAEQIAEEQRALVPPVAVKL